LGSGYRSGFDFGVTGLSEVGMEREFGVARETDLQEFFADPHVLGGSAKKELKPVWRALLCGLRTNKAHGVLHYYE